MNILKVHSCVKLENERLILANKAKKILPELPEHERLMKEIMKLTLEINSLHSEIKGKQ